MIPLFLILAAMGLGLEPVFAGTTANGATVLAVILLGVAVVLGFKKRRKA